MPDPVEVRMRQLGKSGMAEMLHPMINTVDAFQGSERDYILFSPTRHSTYKGGMSGFLEDRKRVCVLLTRARKGFACFGDSRMLEKHPLWKDWLAHVKENGGYLRVSPHIVRFFVFAIISSIFEIAQPSTIQNQSCKSLSLVEVLGDFLSQTLEVAILIQSLPGASGTLFGFKHYSTKFHDAISVVGCFKM